MTTRRSCNPASPRAPCDFVPRHRRLPPSARVRSLDSELNAEDLSQITPNYRLTQPWFDWQTSRQGWASCQCKEVATFVSRCSRRAREIGLTSGLGRHYARNIERSHHGEKRFQSFR